MEVLALSICLMLLLFNFFFLSLLFVRAIATGRPLEVTHQAFISETVEDRISLSFDYFTVTVFIYECAVSLNEAAADRVQVVLWRSWDA